MAILFKAIDLAMSISAQTVVNQMLSPLKFSSHVRTYDKDKVKKANDA